MINKDIDLKSLKFIIIKDQELNENIIKIYRGDLLIGEISTCDNLECMFHSLFFWLEQEYKVIKNEISS